MTIYTMSKAGMTLGMLIEEIKGDGMGLDFDTKSYLAEKLMETFYGIQMDIIAAISTGIEGEE